MSGLNKQKAHRLMQCPQLRITRWIGLLGHADRVLDRRSQ
jgi:hypothetical protein